MDRYLAVNDLSVSTVLVLMQNVSWSSKDTVAVGFLNTWSSLTTGELIQISQASYEQKVPILMNYFIKTSDRTVASALQVVALMSWSDKDTFLLKAVRLVTDLTTANLPALAKSAYEKEAEILRAGLARLGR
ncbi:MAG TPA: hypothetical protein DCS07_12150 [Bdellovibrionales bacterium]|nr:hypothetical protein [Bdellovibrionales bacterium]